MGSPVPTTTTTTPPPYTTITTPPPYTTTTTPPPSTYTTPPPTTTTTPPAITATNLTSESPPPPQCSSCWLLWWRPWRWQTPPGAMETWRLGETPLSSLEILRTTAG